MVFFSMQSFCKKLLLVGDVQNINPKIWVGVCPLKVKMFGWIARLQKILSIDNPRLHKMIIVNACPLCLSATESVSHLLLHCKFSYQIWIHFFQLLGVLSCLPHSCGKLFNEDVVVSGTSFRRSLWWVTSWSIVWSIWLERNNRIFHGKERYVTFILDIIKIRAAWWLVGSPTFRGVSISDVCRDSASIDSIIPSWMRTIQVP